MVFNAEFNIFCISALVKHCLSQVSLFEYVRLSIDTSVRKLLGIFGLICRIICGIILEFWEPRIEGDPKTAGTRLFESLFHDI